MQNTVTREVSNTAIAIRQSSVRRWDAVICSCVVRTEYASPVAMQAYIPTSMDDTPLMEFRGFFHEFLDVVQGIECFVVFHVLKVLCDAKLKINFEYRV